jgi:hypothetical protein
VAGPREQISWINQTGSGHRDDDLEGVALRSFAAVARQRCRSPTDREVVAGVHRGAAGAHLLRCEVAGLGQQLRWFLGNVYEAGVDMPQLLAAVDVTLPLNGSPLVPSTGSSRQVGPLHERPVHGAAADALSARAPTSAGPDANPDYRLLNQSEAGPVAPR